MAKLAILFAGQGAQKAGMGKSLNDNIPASRAVFDAAEETIPGIRALCFEGAQEELNKTVNTQPAVFTVDMAAFAALGTLGIRPAMGAGFSLGEYAALAAAGVLPFDETLKLVQARARWMQEAAEAHAGGMAAVLGKSGREVEEIVAAVKGGGLLIPVNYNCPGQTVVAGDEEELQKLLVYAKENKIKCMRLPVNGAFHSEHMRGAAKQIYETVEPMTFTEPEFMLYANKTATPYELVTFKTVMAEQTASPVLFEQIARDMIARGCDVFVEVGPGNALAGFVKRIDKELSIYNIKDYESFGATKEALDGMKF